jgi:hypothetical protein
MSKDTGGPAFPVPGLHENNDYDGMTLRDYFAAKAMQSMIQTPPTKWPEDMMGRSISVCAYEMADSMLNARGQE